MQFSESWLRSLCNPALSNEELCHLLTMAGLEVEENEPVAPGVFQCRRRPGADRREASGRRQAQALPVDVGEAAPLQIVCGAPNVAAGMKVPMRPCRRQAARH
jgi:phenylalanyl-tRNA synthetase beta chain